MKLTGTKEWIAIGILVALIAFGGSLSPVRQLVGSPIGKALALGAVVFVWKTVSKPVALLLLVLVLKTGPFRESMTGGPNCPTGSQLQSDKTTCKDPSTGKTTPAILCVEGQIWNQTASKCEGASVADAPTGGIAPNVLTTPTGTTIPGVTLDLPPPTPEVVGDKKESFTGGYQPNDSGVAGNFAPA